MERDFKKSLEYGQIAEGAIVKWLIERGNSVIPVYEKEIDTGKGPQVFTANESVVAPDVLVYKNGKFFFAECKRKNAFTWHRISKRWTTGIDIRHYKEYLKVSDIFETEVYLFFLQMGGVAKDSEKSPSGLFYNSLSFLSKDENINHVNDKWAKGMIYWSIDKLIKIAEIDSFELAP